MKRPDGGVQQRRGAHYQDWSLVFYTILRLREAPDLVLVPESVEDAEIRYPGAEPAQPQIELVQCKKREGDAQGWPHRGEDMSDSWLEGRYTSDDLRRWLKPDLVDRLKAHPGVVFTVLAFGQLTKKLLPFVPTGLRSHLPIIIPPTDLPSVFPIGLRHAELPSKLPLQEPDVLSRTRLLSTGSPRELRVTCEIVLREDFGVLAGEAPRVLSRLWKSIHEASLTRKPLPGSVMRALLADGRRQRSRWWQANELLDVDGGRHANPNRGEAPLWSDFEAGRFDRRSEFDEAESALGAEGAFVVLTGAVGSGKTTACRYLVYRHVLSEEAGPAYYLAVEPGMEVTDEISFLEQSLHEPALFVVDDEHLSSEAVDRMIETFLDRRILGRVRARLLVTSKTPYGRAADAGEIMRTAVYVPLPQRDEDAVHRIMSVLKEHSGLRTSLTSAELASLSKGVVSLALLIARSTPPESSPPYRSDLASSKKLKAHLLNWIVKKVRRDEAEQDLATPVITVFVLGAYGIAVPEEFHPVVPRLLEVGLFRRSGARGGCLPGATNVAFILQEQEKERHAEFLGSYIELYPERLADVVSRVAAWKGGRAPLQELVRAHRRSILEGLRGRPETLSLGQISDMLGAIRLADRRASSDLFLDWVAPARSADGHFFSDLVARARFLTELTRLVERLHRLDHGARWLPLMAKSQILRHEREKLMFLFELPSTRPDQVANFLRVLSLVSREVAAELFTAWWEADDREQQLRRFAEDEDGPAMVLRFSRELQPLNRGLAIELLEDLLSLERVRSILLSGAGHFADIVLFLQRLHQAHPRWASTAVAEAWDQSSEAISIKLRREGDLDSLTQGLYALARVNKPIAIQAAWSVESRLGHLIREEQRYAIVGSKLEFLRRHLASRLAEELCEVLDRARTLERLLAENRYVDTVGKFLFDLARVSPNTAAWFEQRLAYSTFLKVARSPRLRDTVLLVRGFLVAAHADWTDQKEPRDSAASRPASTPPPDSDARGRRDELLRIMKQDRSLIHFLHRQWDEAESLTELAFCLSALGEAGLATPDVLHLVGFGNTEEILQDFQGRLHADSPLLHVTNGLYGLAGLSVPEARRLLEHYVEQVDEGRRGSRKGFGHDKDLVENGRLLQVAAALDIGLAQRLLAMLAPEALAHHVLEETNLGRLSVFLNGVLEVSRRKALSLTTTICSEERWREQYERNDQLENIPLHVRSLARIDHERAAAFARLVVVEKWPELETVLGVQADLGLLSRWVHLVRTAGVEPTHRHLPALARISIETLPFDGRLLNLFSSAEAFGQAGDLVTARVLADRAREAIPQARGVRQLRRWITLFNKAEHVDHMVPGVGLAKLLCDSTRELSFGLLLATEKEVILQALMEQFLSGVAFADTLREVVSGQRRSIRDRALEQPDDVRKVVALVLLGEPAATVQDAMDRAHWRNAWELGLVALLVKAFVPGMVGTLSLADDETRRRLLRKGLGPDARNLDFALSRWLAIEAGGTLADLPRLTPGTLDRLTAERKAQETSSVVRWLLATDDPSLLRARRYGLWRLLQDTVLRPSFLPWGSDIERATDALAFKRRSFFRDLATLGSTAY